MKARIDIEFESLDAMRKAYLEHLIDARTKTDILNHGIEAVKTISKGKMLDNAAFIQELITTVWEREDQVKVNVVTAKTRGKK